MSQAPQLWNPLSPPRLIMNYTAHILPRKMSQYSMKSYIPDNLKKYRTILVGGLWAEQFIINRERLIIWKLKILCFFSKLEIYDFSQIFPVFNICSLQSFNHAFHKCPTIWKTTNPYNLNIFYISLQNKQILLGHLLMITLY